MFKAIKDFFIGIINKFRKPKTQVELEHDSLVQNRLFSLGKYTYETLIYEKLIKDKSPKRETYNREMLAGNMLLSGGLVDKQRKPPEFSQASFNGARQCFFYAKKAAQTPLEKEKAERSIETVDYLLQNPGIELKPR